MVKKEEILARTSNGLDVFRHYLPVKWRVGRNFLNPLYADSKASCNVYYDRRSGTYRMKDFGNGDFSGDCFFLVARLKGLDCRNAADFVEVLHTINRELCLGLDGESPNDADLRNGNSRTLRLVPSMRVNETGGSKGGARGFAGGSRHGHGGNGSAPRTSRTEALPGGGEALHGGGACLLGRIGHHAGNATPLRGGVALGVPGRDKGGQGVRLQLHPGGTDVRV